jgi:HEAT repeat protein
MSDKSTFLPLTHLSRRAGAFAALLALTLIFFTAAYAQQRESNRRAGARRANPSSTAQPTPPPRQTQASRRRLTPLRSSDTASGSRLTITSDGVLNDYEAYRSGDRFYVRIPQAEAGGAGGVSGRGFSGAEVRRQGNDVIYSFRLQPGASARVNQRFNRLDVEFTAPGGGGAQSNQSQTVTTSSPRPAPSIEPRGQNQSVEPRNTTPANQDTARNALPTDTARQQQTLPPFGTEGQTNLPPLPQDQTVPPLTSELPPVGDASPEATAPSTEIAQVMQTPATTAPVAPENSGAGTGASFGAALARNWLWVILAVALLVGIGLFFFARASEGRSAAPPPPPPPSKETLPAAATASTSTVDTDIETESALIAPAAIVTSAQTSAAITDNLNTSSGKVTTPLTVAPLPAVANIATTEGEEATEEITAAHEETGVQEIEVEGKSAEAQLLNSGVIVAAPAVVTSPPIDSERIGIEVRNLLDGRDYDESVIGASDANARQIIGTELLAAIAGRNHFRRQNALQAFSKHGYFEQTVRDLSDAAAPAERASAARALGLIHDHTATPVLVEALHDESPEVRRASVEALASLRDSAAREPLEQLLARETNRNVPPILIQHAIDASSSPVISEPIQTSIATSTEPAITETESDVATVELSQIDTGVDLQTVEVETPLPVQETIEAENLETVDAHTPHTFEVVEEPLPQLATEHDSQAELTASETATQESFFQEPSINLEQSETIYTETASFDSISDYQSAPTGEITAPSSDEWLDVDFSSAHLDPLREAESIEPITDESSTIPNPVAVPEHSAYDEELDDALIYSVPVELQPETSFEKSQLDVSPVERQSPAKETFDGAGIEMFTSQEIDAGLAPFQEVPTTTAQGPRERLTSAIPDERAMAVLDLARTKNEDVFDNISAAFDDSAPEVRSAAAQALYDASDDRIAAFTRALREATPERRRRIGAAIASSGLAGAAISNLTGESREKTYDAFSLLFLMAKAGEIQPLTRAIETHPNNEVRLAVVKLLALSGQQEILPSFRRLAVRGSLPPDVRAAVMEAIYQISNQPTSNTSSTI